MIPRSRRRALAGAIGALAVVGAMASTPRASVAVGHVAQYRLSGQGIVDTDLIWYATTFVIDRDGREHVVGFVHASGQGERLVYLTKKAGASQWTRTNSAFTLPDINDTEIV